MSEKVMFTAGLAYQNYWELAEFLVQDVFDGVSRLPYSIRKFISLLRGNPLSHRYLLARHYGILPTKFRAHVISSFAKRTLTLPKNEQEAVERIMDNVDIGKNWDLNEQEAVERIMDNVDIGKNWDLNLQARNPSDVRYHEKLFMKISSKDRYEVDISGLRTHYFLRYCRNCLSHIDPGLEIRHIVWALNDRFPFFYTDMVIALANANKLARFRINPGDRTIDADG